MLKPIWSLPPGVARLQSIVAGPVGTGTNPTSYLDGWGFDNSYPPNVGPQTGLKIAQIAQTALTVAGTVANQWVGTVALPAIAAGATQQVVISNTLISAISTLTGHIARRLASDGGTVPAAGAQGALSWNEVSRVAGTSITLEVRNNGSAATLATDYIISYEIKG